MKKIGKLSINPEKVLNNEELVNLKGGYDVFYCQCHSGNNNCVEVLADDIWEAINVMDGTGCSNYTCSVSGCSS